VQKPSPTFFQIISRDYLAQNFFIMIFGGWVIYGIDALFEGRVTFFLAAVAAMLTPLGLLTFFWRYRLIVSTFVTSIETISTGKRRRDTIIHYEYELNGQKYEFRNRVKKNSFVKTLKQGQQVHLLAHEKTPHIAFIKEIYLESI
jgi:hypothetical protein